MQTEVEVKFLAINIEQTRRKLAELGAVCEQPMRLMRRVMADVPQHLHDDAFVRVRDEGSKIVMTYKQFDALSVDGAKEIEIVVDDFDRARQLLEALGYEMQSYQETRRETWRLGEAEIVLDEWPWLKPYLEIEAADEKLLRETAAKLELEWGTAVFGDVMAAYRAEYLHLTDKDTVGHVPVVRFDEPLPDLLKSAAADS